MDIFRRVITSSRERDTVIDYSAPVVWPYQVGVDRFAADSTDPFVALEDVGSFVRFDAGGAVDARRWWFGSWLIWWAVFWAVADVRSCEFGFTDNAGAPLPVKVLVTAPNSSPGLAGGLVRVGWAEGA